ncbi:MAG: helicase-exonuclease AddAB subunit AddB, partial [Lachnospiraceae bacterium]|nr:helicase-exonuclease AddAB subunit AddB [Lachnospiraceae bacterium]
MSLHWIFGGSGYGKSHYVYNEIMKQSECNPSGRYIVIVPEQFTMQTQKDMVMLSKAKGIMNIDVLSFVRLAYRVLEQTTALDKPLLEDEGKGMVIRRILREHAGEWKTFGSNITRMGFVEEIKSVVTEFVQYRVDDDKLEDMLDGVKDKGILASKIRDIGLVYKYYREYMEERYISSEELLSILADYVPESDMVKGSVMCIDGFTGFTPVQYELLRELMKVCSDIYITVTIGSRSQTFGRARPDELFYMSRTYINKCMDIAKETGTYAEDPVWAGT